MSRLVLTNSLWRRPTANGSAHVCQFLHVVISHPCLWHLVSLGGWHQIKDSHWIAHLFLPGQWNLRPMCPGAFLTTSRVQWSIKDMDANTQKLNIRLKRSKLMIWMHSGHWDNSNSCKQIENGIIIKEVIGIYVNSLFSSCQNGQKICTSYYT